jgi:hypothetical protein
LAIGISLNLVVTNPAGKGLSFEVTAILLVWRAPRYVHAVFAYWASRRVGFAKAVGMMRSLCRDETNPARQLAFLKMIN